MAIRTQQSKAVQAWVKAIFSVFLDFVADHTNGIPSFPTSLAPATLNVIKERSFVGAPHGASSLSHLQPGFAHFSPSILRACLFSSASDIVPQIVPCLSVQADPKITTSPRMPVASWSRPKGNAWTARPSEIQTRARIRQRWLARGGGFKLTDYRQANRLPHPIPLSAPAWDPPSPRATPAASTPPA